MCDLVAALNPRVSSISGWKCNSNRPWRSSVCAWSGVTCANVEIISLSLPRSQLNGSIPLSIWKLSSLTTIDFSMNKLGGTLPSTVGFMTRLRSLILSHNRFSGSIPSTIAYMSSLTNLNVSSNMFSSSLPNMLEKLSNLKSICAASTSLTGSVPSSLCDAGLTYLAVSQSEFTCFADCLSTVAVKNYGNLLPCVDKTYGK